MLIENGYVLAPCFGNDPAHRRTRYWMQQEVNERPKSGFESELRHAKALGYVRGRLEAETSGNKLEALNYWNSLKPEL